MQRIAYELRHCISALDLLRRNKDQHASADPRQAQEQVRRILEEFATSISRLGYKESDTRDMCYAVTATADEFALDEGSPLREQWMQTPLQVQIFGENRAGDGFFERLERILRSRSPPEVLWVYQMCLLLGFRGRYGTPDSANNLKALTRRLSAQLHKHCRHRSLSPKAHRRRSQNSQRRPSSAWLWLMGLSAVFAVISTLTLRAILTRETQQNLMELAEHATTTYSNHALRN